MKPYKRCVKFANKVTIALSDEQVTKIKFVDLDGLYNFVVDDFFQLKSFTNKIFYLKFSKFEFQISNYSNRVI